MTNQNNIRDKNRSRVINFALFGAGRIAKIHAKNITNMPNANLKYIIDIDKDKAEILARAVGAKVVEQSIALNDPTIDAILIASPTVTHAEIVLASAQANKAIFCEKPLSLDIENVIKCLKLIKERNIKFQIGFQRRFDPSLGELYRSLQDGIIGNIEMIKITSRDRDLPEAIYYQQCGDIFHDMTIHDFDMLMWLLMDDKPIEIFAEGSCLIKASDDNNLIDTSTVIIKTQLDRICIIDNSRRAVYGYDQRVEVLGSKGMLKVSNPHNSLLSLYKTNQTISGTLLQSFHERYQLAYYLELTSFVDAIINDTNPKIPLAAAYHCMVLADAAKRSVIANSPTKIDFLHEI